MSVHFHSLRIAGIERDADALVLRLDLAGLDTEARKAFRFQAGQYLTLRASVGGDDLRRNYSICSGTDERDLRVAIRAVPGGRFSAWSLTALQVGQTLQVLPPDGRFVYIPDPLARRHLVCIAAGSGITPMLSILKTLLAQEPRSRATLILGNRNLASIMFREELAELKNRHMGRLALHHVFSRESQEAPLFNGRLDQDKLGQFLQTLVPAASIDEAYVCGPAGMLDAACAALAASGVPVSRVHVERFTDGLGAEVPRHIPAAGDAQQARIALVIDGLAREIEFRPGDRSVLDAALRSGIELPFACKAGVCSTCRGRLLEGQVRMDRNFALTPEEVDQGFVLCCQAHPSTPRVRITLDQR